MTRSMLMALSRSGRLRVTTVVWGCGVSTSTSSDTESPDGMARPYPAKVEHVLVMALDLERFVGAQGGPPFTARDAVNEAMIRHWCDAVGDANPIYTDPEAAASSRHGGIVAPPTMLQAWTMRGLNPPPRKPGPQSELMAELDAAGFTSVVATNCDQEYERYLRPGDVLTATEVIESV